MIVEKWILFYFFAFSHKVKYKQIKFIQRNNKVEL